MNPPNYTRIVQATGRDLLVFLPPDLPQIWHIAWRVSKTRSRSWMFLKPMTPLRYQIFKPMKISAYVLTGEALNLLRAGIATLRDVSQPIFQEGFLAGCTPYALLVFFSFQKFFGNCVWNGISFMQMRNTGQDMVKQNQLILRVYRYQTPDGVWLLVMPVPVLTLQPLF